MVDFPAPFSPTLREKPQFRTPIGTDLGSQSPEDSSSPQDWVAFWGMEDPVTCPPLLGQQWRWPGANRRGTPLSSNILA